LKQAFTTTLGDTGVPTLKLITSITLLLSKASIVVTCLSKDVGYSTFSV